MNLRSLTSSLDMFIDYIQGESLESLTEHIKCYDRHPVRFNRDFRLISIVHEQISEKIKKILAILNIPQNRWDDYLKSNTVYDFLEQLSKDGHDQINDILKVLDTKFSLSKLEWILGGIFSATIIAVIFSNPALSGVVAVLKEFVTSAIGLPILSVIYTGAFAIYSVSQNQLDNRKPLFNRFRDGFFLLANSILNLVAYGLLIGASAVMAPVAGVLFVAASAVDVVKEIFTLIQGYIQYKNEMSLPEGNPLVIEQSRARREFGYAKHRNALLINMVTSMFLAGIIAVSCFIPGGVFVSIACVAAMGLVYTAKTIANSQNEEIMRVGLQKELKNLEIIHQDGPFAGLQDTDELQNEHANSMTDSIVQNTHQIEPVLEEVEKRHTTGKYVTSGVSALSFFQPENLATAKGRRTSTQQQFSMN